jgi:ankyrin repeat protein
MVKTILPQNDLKEYTVFRDFNVPACSSDNNLRNFYQGNSADTISAEKLLESLSPGYTVISGMDKESADQFRYTAGKLTSGNKIVIAPAASFGSIPTSDSKCSPVFWNNSTDLEKYFEDQCFKNECSVDFPESLKYLPSSIFIFDLCTGEDRPDARQIRGACTNVVNFCSRFKPGRHRFVVLLEKLYYLDLETDDSGRRNSSHDDTVSPKSFIENCSPCNYWHYQQLIPKSFKTKRYNIENFHTALSYNRATIGFGTGTVEKQALVKRQWLDDEVSKRLGSGSILLLQGGPGAGKSTFMSQFATKESAGTAICAAGFNARIDNSSSVNELLCHLMLQMADSLGWRIDTDVKDIPKAMGCLSRAVSAHIGQGKPVFMPDMNGFWTQKQGIKQFLVCIDGLDEASEKRDYVLRDTLKSIHHNNMQVIASGRPEVVKGVCDSDKTKGKEISILDIQGQEFRENVNNDIRGMLEAAGCDKEVREQIIQKADGCFLVAELLREYIEDQGVVKLKDVEPAQAYSVMYEHFWNGRSLEGLTKNTKRMISIVFGFSRSSVPERLLNEMFEAKGFEYEGILERLCLNNMVYYTGDGYVVFHESLRDWLKETYCQTKDYRYKKIICFLADWCKKWYEYSEESECETYALMHALDFIYESDGSKGLNEFFVPLKSPREDTKKGIFGFLTKKERNSGYFDIFTKLDKDGRVIGKSNFYVNHLNENSDIIDKCLNQCSDLCEYVFLADTMRYLQQSFHIPKGIEGEICVAAIMGRLDILKPLIELNNDISSIIMIYDYLLPYAVRSGKIEVVKYVINDCEVTPKYMSGYNRMYFLEALAEAKPEFVNRILTEYLFTADLEDQEGETLLFKACRKGNLELAKLLIEEHDVDFNHEKSLGELPLHAAACSGNLELVRYLINVYIRDSQGRTVLFDLASGGHLEILKSLIKDRKVDFKQEIQDAFWEVLVEECDFEKVKYLVSDYKADPNLKDTQGRTAISYALEYGDFEMVKYLIDDCKVDLNQQDIRDAFVLAVREGDLEIVKYLINDCGVDPNQLDIQDRPLLFDAVEGCSFETNEPNFELIKYLINDCNVDPNQLNSEGKTLLFAAVSCGHLELVKYLINDCKVDPNQLDIEGRTLLFDAALFGDLEIVKCLINDCKADVNHQDFKGETALFDAVSSGYIDIVEFLNDAAWDRKLEIVKYFIEECSMKPVFRCNDGRTPLHYAAENGRLEIVKYLIEDCKADYSVESDLGHTAYDIAVAEGNNKITEYLKSVSRSHRLELLNSSIKDGNLEIVKRLLTDCEVDPNYQDGDGCIALFAAARNGQFEIVRCLIEECGLDPNQLESGERTLLFAASSCGHLELVKYLISDCKIDVNHESYIGETALFAAAENGHLEIVTYLINYCKVDPNHYDHNGGTALFSAAFNGYLGIVEYFINECKADPSLRSYDGITALLCAAGGGQLEIVKYLINDCKADPNEQSDNGETALLRAAQNGHFEVVRYLINECNANPVLRDYEGVTPLHAAAQNSYIEIVKYLIEEYGVNPSVQDSRKKTPLHYAAQSGSLEIVKYLIEKCGVDFAFKDGEGKTAYDIAVERGYDQISKYLSSKAGDA